MSTTTTMLDAATAHARAGRAVIPIPSREKNPNRRGWQAERLTEADLPRRFAGNGNMGLLTGEPSGWLVDVDCDVPEARDAARELLPATAMRHGRPGNPGSHFWYVAEGARTTKFEYQGDDADPTTKTMLIELRSTGCQTVVPPSIHPDGEAYVWESQGEPAEVDAVTLPQAVGRVAACALMARHWPGRGSRDDAAMALAGMLIHAGWDVDEADHFVSLAARLAGDEEWCTGRRGKAAQAARKHEAGQAVTGAPKLAETLRDGRRVVEKAREWLGMRRVAEQAPGQPKMPNAPKMPEDAPSENVGTFTNKGHLRQVKLCDVQPEQVSWLDKGYIPLGKITNIIGDPGLGKTTLTHHLVACHTTGRPMPGGTRNAPASAVLMSAEDGLADTIVPRLKAAGADLTRVTALTSVDAIDEDGQLYERPLSIPRDIPRIRAAIEESGATLLVIDPLTAYLDADVNSHRDQDVRRALAPLATMADTTGCAVVLVRHLNKASGGNTLYRGGGSIGITGAARAELVVAVDPDDDAHRVVAVHKHNLHKPVPALTFELRETADEQPYVYFLGTSQHTAAQLLAAPADEESRTETDEAADWLRDLIESKGGQIAASEGQEAARKQGISPKVLRSARMRICEKPQKGGFSDGWAWKLKVPSPAKMPEDALSQNVGTLDTTWAPSCLDSPTGQHEYANQRGPRGQLLCIHCQQPKGGAAA